MMRYLILQFFLEDGDSIVNDTQDKISKAKSDFKFTNYSV